MRNIHTVNGYITGATSLDGEIEIYKGIPYAKPPIGGLRWRAPQPLGDWEGVKSCVHFGPNAVQEHGDLSQPWMAPYSMEFLTMDELGYREDCLHLNIWTKANEVDRRPVVVYIHGGGFGSGSGSIPIYDGENLARQGIVYVSINYRVGLLGFLTNEKLSNESELGISGNYGIMDQIQSLKWIQENIEAFGGDSENITIVGQSAGSGSVQILATSPYARGLFKNVFAMSFTYFNGKFMTTQQELETTSQNFFKQMTLDDMRSMSVEELLGLNIEAKPCVDGELILKFVTESFLEGNHHADNMLIGVVSGDTPLFQVLRIGNPFAPLSSLSVETYESAIKDTFGELSIECIEAYPALGDAMRALEALNQDSMKMNIYYLSKRIKAKRKTTIYNYYFDHILPGVDGKNYGAFHTADVPYWLGNLDKLSPARIKRLTEVDYALSKKLMEYFINFAKTGNPNGEDLVKWYPFDEDHVNSFYIGDDEFLIEGFTHKQLRFWKKYYESVLY